MKIMNEDWRYNRDLEMAKRVVEEYIKDIKTHEDDQYFYDPILGMILIEYDVKDKLGNSCVAIECVRNKSKTFMVSYHYKSGSGPSVDIFRSKFISRAKEKGYLLSR